MLFPSPRIEGPRPARRLAATLAVLGWLSLGFPANPWADSPLPDRLERLNERLAASPDDSRLLLERSRLRWRAGDGPGALLDLERVDALDPAWIGETATRRAGILLDMGAHPEAWDALQPAFDLGEPPAEAFLVRARLLARTDPLGAALDYGRALDGLGHDPQVEVDRCRAWGEADYPDRMRAQVTAALDAMGPVPGLWELALECLSPEVILAHVATWQESSHANPLYEVDRARALDSMGRTLEAEAAWTLVLDHLDRLCRDGCAPARAELARTVRTRLDLNQEKNPQ